MNGGKVVDVVDDVADGLLHRCILCEYLESDKILIEFGWSIFARLMLIRMGDVKRI